MLLATNSSIPSYILQKKEKVPYTPSATTIHTCTSGGVFMDSYEWKHQMQSDHQPCAKLLKISLEDHQSPDSALTLFTPEPSVKNDEIAPAPTSIPFAVPRMGHFSWTQWQELELQALIYKYIISGVAVPLELIVAIKRSLLSASPYYTYPLLYHHLCPFSLQSGYWGRFAVDPEPGRCRRTDGKKWRCAREAMPGQKYCERHVHRGRNRSRKHVETPSPTLASCLRATMPSAGSTTEHHFTPSESLRTLDILPLNQSRNEMDHVNGSYQKNSFFQGFESDNKHESHVLRRFFDEQPRSDEGPNTTSNENHLMHSLDHLPMPIPGSSSSEFSLKLCMRNAQLMPVSERSRFADNEGVPAHQPSANWLGWGGRGEAPLGGPLAEALRRSSTLSDSPRSVLQKPKGSVSETTSAISV